MTQTASNIVLPGPVLVYMAAASTAEPANTVAKGTAWGGSWTEVGFTKGGVVAKPTWEKVVVTSDQTNARVKSFLTQVGIEITFAAQESTLTNIKQALGFGTLTSGSTESTFKVAGTEGWPTNYAIGFECFAPGATSSNGYYRRLVVFNGSMEEGPELKSAKEEEMLVAFKLVGEYDSTNTGVWKLIDRNV